MSIHCYCSFNLNKIWLDATVENKGIFKVAIVKICCISWAPAIFHLWWPSFHRCKNSCIWINYSSIRNLLLFRLFQNVLITNGIWILLYNAASTLTKWCLMWPSKFMVALKRRSPSHVVLGQHKFRIGTVNCPYSWGAIWARIQA